MASWPRVLILCLLCALALSTGGSRVKRQNAGFTIIHNETLPCATVSTSQYSELPYRELTDEEKLMLLQHYGGQWMPRIMATSQQEVMSLPSLLPVSTQTQENIRSRDSGDKPISKQDIVDYMINHVYTDLHTQQQQQHETGTNHGKQKQPDPSSTRNSFRDTFQTIANEKDISKRRQKWRHWIDADDVNKGFPFIFPELMGLPKTHTESEGEQQLSDFCVYRGDVTQDAAHVRLCTVCSASTDYGPTRWPQYVNEASCAAGDDGCLFADDFANGSCQQVTMAMMMLLQNPDVCVLVLSGGEHIITQEWTWIYEDVNVGCECNVKENSYFVVFVPVDTLA